MDLLLENALAWIDPHTGVIRKIIGIAIIRVLETPLQNVVVIPVAVTQTAMEDCLFTKLTTQQLHLQQQQALQRQLLLQPLQPQPKCHGAHKLGQTGHVRMEGAEPKF